MIRTILLTVSIGCFSGMRFHAETTADWLLTHALHGNGNYKVLAQRSTDVTFDGKPETLIAFEDVTDENAQVPFFIVDITGSKRTILFRNDALVQCKQCGGVFTEHGEFTINQHGIITFTGLYGSRQRGEHSVSIRFDRSSRRWLVSAASYSWYDSVDPNANNPGALGSWCIDANDFPMAFPADSIKESTWDVLDSFQHYAYYQVTADRVPFSRSCPDEDKPKAYLTKGDVVESKYKLKDKISCEYTVKNTRT